MEIQCSIVVPVYNSADSLSELVTRIAQVLEDNGARPFEIVFVDDGSPNPASWKTLSHLSEQNTSVTAIQLMRNFGRGNAVLAGLAHVRGSRIVIMDDDLQHRPEDIPRLLEVTDTDIVFARFPRRQHSIFVKLASGIKSWFDRILIGVPRGVKISPYLCITHKVAEEMLKVRTPYPFIGALLFFVTRDVAMVDVGHEPRRYGNPAFTVIRRIKQFMRLLINNSSFLLQVVATVGGAIAVFSLFFGGVVVYRALADQIDVAGWASLMVVLLFLGGTILFSLGVIGEYLIRIVNSTEMRPPFIVRRVKSSDGERTGADTSGGLK